MVKLDKVQQKRDILFMKWERGNAYRYSKFGRKKKIINLTDEDDGKASKKRMMHGKKREDQYRKTGGVIN